MSQLNQKETETLELGMEARKKSIPEENRCPECGGRCHVQTGCAVFYAIYSLCFECGGTGRKDEYDLRKRDYKQEVSGG